MVMRIHRPESVSRKSTFLHADALIFSRPPGHGVAPINVYEATLD